MKRASAPSAADQAATFAACPPAPACVTASASAPGESGSSNRTITSRRRSPRQTTRTARIVPWTESRRAVVFRRSSSAGWSVRQPRLRQRGAVVLDDIQSAELPRDSLRSRARRVTERSWSSSSSASAKNQIRFRASSIVWRLMSASPISSERPSRITVSETAR